MNDQKQQRFVGINASPGIAIGPAYYFNREKLEIPHRKIGEEEVESEIARLNTALRRARRDLHSIKQMISNRIGENYADLVQAQLMSLDDKPVLDEVRTRIRERLENAECAFQKVLSAYREQLENSDNVYVRDRASEVSDVKQRVLRHLLTRDGGILEDVEEPSIIVSTALSPTDMITIDKTKVLGFISETGGRTSHMAILSRALQLPAVVGVDKISENISDGSRLIIDGTHGTVILNPDEETLDQFHGEQEHIKEFEETLYSHIDLPAETRDKTKIILSANIGLPVELENVRASGAEGIGLYRTEYLYLIKNTFPTEEEQFEEYKQITKSCNGDPVIFRTFDLGGDKISATMEWEGFQESNPFLGYRAIRICLDNPQLFKTQLRAIYRASAFGNIKLMFPMISALEEVHKIKKMINEVKDELRSENIPFKEDIELGALIEIPSAALIADELAKELDFFSIGTNDLIQYTLAVDRGNDRVSFLYKMLHPSVLKLIQMTINAGHKNNIWVGICGEMAADPIAVPLLVGLGLDEISVSPIALPKIKEVIRGLDSEQCKHIAENVLSFAQESDVERYLHQFMQQHFPEMLNI